MTGEDRFRGFLIKGRKAGLTQPGNRLPPPLAVRVGSRDDVEVEREMGEDVSDDGKRICVGRRRFAPVIARKRCHPAEQPFRWSSNQPDETVALNPKG
jgi:hypothetical protein